MGRRVPGTGVTERRALVTIVRWMPLIRFVAVALVVLAFPAVCVAASATGNYAYDTSFEVAPPVSSDTDARTTASAHLDGTRTPPQVAEPSPASVPRGSTSSRTRGRATNAGRGGAGPVRLGQAGEDAVRGAYDIGPKATRVINGRTRIFDGLTTSTLSEVKNVGSLSYSSQLRDYVSYAQQTGRQVDLYVVKARRRGCPGRCATRSATRTFRST